MPDATLKPAERPATPRQESARRAGELTDRRQDGVAEHALATTLNRAPAVAAQLQLAATLNAAPRVIAQRQLATSLGGAVVQMGGSSSKDGGKSKDGDKKPPAKPAAKPPVVLDDEIPIPATFDLAAPPPGAAAAAVTPARAPLYPERRFANMSAAQLDELRETDDYSKHRDVNYFLGKLDEVDESTGTTIAGDPVEWLVDRMTPRLPRADFGAAILELVPTIVADASDAGYNVRNTAVLTALDSVVVQVASVGYSTQLGSRQANYGTMQGGTTGNAMLDKRK